MQQPIYDFPVEVQPIRTDNGTLIQGHKGIIRTDNGQMLSLVTNRYSLIKHSQVMEEAERFITDLGVPERRYHLDKKGAIFTAELTYMANKAEVAVGEHVGMRVFILSSYTGTHLNRVKIGGLVLSCKNGMVSPSKSYNFVCRHTGENRMIFPRHDEVLERFYLEAGRWQSYAAHKIVFQKNGYLQELDEAKILPAAGIDYIGKDPEGVKTAWDFLQRCTYFVTHLNDKISPLGKMNRLEKISTWFKQRFG